MQTLCQHCNSETVPLTATAESWSHGDNAPELLIYGAEPASMASEEAEAEELRDQTAPEVRSPQRAPEPSLPQQMKSEAGPAECGECWWRLQQPVSQS